MGHVKDRWYSGRGDAKKPTARHGTGLRWQVWYQVDGHERCGGSFRTKQLADRKLVELEADLHRGQWVDPTDQTTVTDLVRAYAATRLHKPATAARIESCISCHIEPTALGRRRAAAVRPSEIQAWVTSIAAVLAPATVLKVATLVKAAFAAAVFDRVVATTPWVRITLPRADTERIVPLTIDQVRALADHIGDTYRAMIVTQAGLGLRLGELLALRVQDVDFLRRRVRIEDQIDRATRRRVPPKTPKSRRTLPLPDVVAQELAKHIAAHPPAADGLLFHTRDGLPYRHMTYVQGVFPRAVARVNTAADRADAAAGPGAEPALRVPTGTTSHDLRHHFASVLLAAGQTVIAVADLLGHENATLVLTTYGHLMPGTEELARRALDAAWVVEPVEPTGSATAPTRPQ